MTMEMQDNCRCYCYAIMPGLCFPCQVKVHLLHMTPSPHGELARTTNFASPRDRTQGSPCSDQSQTQKSATGRNSVRSDCDRCDYYMNFISKLTSGLCEETIMKMIYSNTCMISSDLPASIGGKKTESPMPPKTGQHEQTRSSRAIEDSTLTYNPSTHDSSKLQVPSKNHNKSTSVASSRISPKVAKKSDMNPSKKPTTPENVMTTDKMLKQSFESIAKKRPPSPTSSRSRSPEKKKPPSRISSRSSSPEKKRQETKQTTVKPTASDHKPTSSNSTPRNEIRTAKNGNKTSTVQKSLSNSGSGKAPKNDPMQRLKAEEHSKKSSKSDGKGGNIFGKKSSKDVTRTEKVPVHSRVSFSKTTKPEPGGNTVNCTEEVCEFQPGNHIQRGSKGEGEKPAGAAEMGKIKVDANTAGGFFEAALVMEFYEPPQQGDGNLSSKAKTKQPPNEHETEPYNPDSGGEIVKQKQKRNSKAKGRDLYEVNDRAEYSKQTEGFVESGTIKQITTKEPSFPLSARNSTRPSDRVEYFPQDNDTASQIRKSSKLKCTCDLSITCQIHPKAGAGEEKRNAIPSDLRKQDVQSREGQSQTPIPGEVTNTMSDKQKIQWNEIGRYPGFDKLEKDEEYMSAIGIDQCESTDQVNEVKRESESRRRSKYSHEDNWTTGPSKTNRTRDLSPANIIQESAHKSKMISGRARESANHQEVEGKPTAAKLEDDGSSKFGRRGRLSEEFEHERPIKVGVIKKIREEIEDEFRRSFTPSSLRQTENSASPSPMRQIDKPPGSISKDEPHKDDRFSNSGRPAQRKSRSPDRRQGTPSCTSVYTTFSEYRNPDCEGYRSKSTGHIADCPSDQNILPVKLPSEKDSSQRTADYPDEEKVYYCSESNHKNATVVIRSNPQFSMNVRKQVVQETASSKVDNTVQKTDHRDSGTQCDYDSQDIISPSRPPPVTEKSSKKRVPPKTSAKPLQSSDPLASRSKPVAHQQVYYNRPLMRRSFQ